VDIPRCFSRSPLFFLIFEKRRARDWLSVFTFSFLLTSVLFCRPNLFFFFRFALLVSPRLHDRGAFRMFSKKFNFPFPPTHHALPMLYLTFRRVVPLTPFLIAYPSPSPFTGPHPTPHPVRVLVKWKDLLFPVAPSRGSDLCASLPPVLLLGFRVATPGQRFSFDSRRASHPPRDCSTGFFSSTPSLARFITHSLSSSVRPPSAVHSVRSSSSFSLVKASLADFFFAQSGLWLVLLPPFSSGLLDTFDFWTICGAQGGCFFYFSAPLPFIRGPTRLLSRSLVLFGFTCL